MIPSWAKIGAKVVCIRTEPSWFDFPGESWPVKDQIYTIRELVCFPEYGDDKVIVRLEEIVNPIVETTDGPLERACLIKDFRPLISLQSDMETHFSRFLSPSPILEKSVG